MGGLGNQLFQLAAGIEIAKVTGRPAKFSTDLLHMPATAGITKRHIGISELLLPDEIIDRNLASGIARLVLNRFGRGSSRLIEENLNDDVTRHVVATTRYVQGYFQNWEIVERSWPEIKKRFQNSKSLSPVINDPVEQRIAVHMRYGDYRSNHHARTFHGLTDTNYFIDCIDFLVESGHPAKIIVVSDEPTLAKQELESAGLSKKYVTQFIGKQSQYRDLSLIASSSSIVMSNSTFSWWGAWVASVLHQSTVVFPQPWLSSDDLGTTNLLAPKWIPRMRKILT
jgi:hypothetical protein